jgi:preprotein translocase subunit SecE
MLSRRAVAQLARVAVSKAAGWGFESLLPCKMFYTLYPNEVRKEMTMTESVEQVAEKLGLFARVGLFYRQVISELRKVVWPTRNQLTTYTAVVLVFVSFIIAVVSLIDLVLTKVVFWVFG